MSMFELTWFFCDSKQKAVDFFINQSRICGKGIGLGLFPSDSLQSQSYQFIGIAHIGPYNSVENDYRNFRSNRMNRFGKSKKKSKNGCFWPFLD